MKKDQKKLNQEAGTLILIGALIIVILSVTILLLELVQAKGAEYTTNITIVIPFIALAIAFITWKNFFFADKKKGKK